MTQSEIFNNLIKIAKFGKRDPFICCDMVDQEDLFEIQQRLLLLIDSINQNKAIKEIPYMYELTKES